MPRLPWLRAKLINFCLVVWLHHTELVWHASKTIFFIFSVRYCRRTHCTSVSFGSQLNISCYKDTAACWAGSHKSERDFQQHKLRVWRFCYLPMWRSPITRYLSSTSPQSSSLSSWPFEVGDTSTITQDLAVRLAVQSNLVSELVYMQTSLAYKLLRHTITLILISFVGETKTMCVYVCSLEIIDFW